MNFNRITKLKSKILDLNHYMVIDIETFKHPEIDTHIPYAVAIKGPSFYYQLQLRTNTNDIIGSSHNMINSLIDNILVLSNRVVYIYAHNLGSFDGYFILKSLLLRNDSVKDINLLIDSFNNIIEIKYKNLIFRDSYRIFPASLADLGIICNLNLIKKDFNYNSITIKSLKSPIVQLKISQYLRRDIEKLDGIIGYYKEMILSKYHVKLKDVYSTSSLAFKVFRTMFLKRAIHSSTLHEYNLIKPSYFGGSVQLYTNNGHNLYYYDVNSLYPYVMLKPLPEKYISTIKNVDVTEFIDKNYFGFIDCEIEIPDSVNRPQVPVRHEGSVIYPTGHIKGRYFSEEVKSWINLGYKIKINNVFIFTKAEGLFDDYINYFYKLKSNKNLTNEKFLNKLLLNGLYGYFGRSWEYENCDIIKSNDLEKYNKNYDILSQYNLGNDLNIVKYKNKPPTTEKEIWDMLDNKRRGNLINIAISASIASYGRIHMQNFKLLPDNDVIYSDTDSIILTKPLTSGVGEGIGDMKLEYQIKEAIFIKPKLYGFITEKGEEVIKSAGFPQKTITFEDLKNLLNNQGYIKNIKTTNFYKDLNSLSIEIKETNLELKINSKTIVKYKMNKKGLIEPQNL